LLEWVLTHIQKEQPLVVQKRRLNLKNNVGKI
jgi:hypothetical protein